MKKVKYEELNDAEITLILEALVLGGLEDISDNTDVPTRLEECRGTVGQSVETWDKSISNMIYQTWFKGYAVQKLTKYALSELKRMEKDRRTGHEKKSVGNK